MSQESELNMNTVPPQHNNKTSRTVKEIADKKEEFNNIIRSYLENNPAVSLDRKTHELEIRFGTNSRLSRPITKIDYDNVVKQIKSCGFVSEYIEGIQLLRIQTEYTDNRTGKIKMSNTRAEIVGSDLIQEYCRTNSLQKVIDMPSTLLNKIKFTQKITAKRENGEWIDKVDMDDYNFRVSYQTEQDFNVQSYTARNIISKWTDSKKRFRSLNRVRFRHPDYPIFVDISIVKSSKTTKGIHIPAYTIQEANVFNNPENYEIELEIDNSRVGKGTEFNKVESLMISLRKCIRIVLSGLQGTKYPISYLEREDILQKYLKLLYADKYINRRVNYKDFVGPGSTTLQVENIVEPIEGSSITNIRKHYTVTEKADGDRMLLYVSSDGKIYMIDTNMNVIFTGSKTSEKTIYNSLLDGEHIVSDKTGNSVNIYTAFDVYYVNTKSVREFPFIKTTEDIDQEEGEVTESRYRLDIMKELIDLLNPKSVLEMSDENNQETSSNIVIKSKTFCSDIEYGTIFAACSKKLSDIQDGLFEYNTDGLIFTPADYPVGGNIESGVGPLKKITWEHSFKWKPPEFNTIDFLVYVKRDNNGREEIHNIFQDGRNMVDGSEINQYKTIILNCGFDQKKHGFINPCQDILNDNLPNPDDIDNADTYQAVPFQPTNPYDPTAHICNMMLSGTGNNQHMFTEEGEYFEDNMIVEFKYKKENKQGWKWVPIRVRYDKIAKLRAGKPEYGNAYHVANSNWRSIHYPITDVVLSTGENIPMNERNDEVYYNRSDDETSTQGLRDFHNLFVKKHLIVGVSNRGDTLIDYAVGKAGDMSKWRMSNLKFVLGIDISKDNIHNQLDGACARYLKSCKKNKNIFKALFVRGDSSNNIRNGEGLKTDKDKEIVKAVFGNGPKDIGLLGKGVYNQYGIAEAGFNVSSCQFAMHYFFEDKTTFHHFIRNLTECTKIGGHFIGTCYDGETVFNLLKDKIKGEGMTIMKNGRKIYEVTKMYDKTGFPAEEMSLGYDINVYQESINQTFREYLVNFEYFTRIMEDYGFILITKEEAITMDLPDGTGLFSELYSNMEQELKQNTKRKHDYGTAMYMSAEEKRISFMNRYFVFKKIRSVDAKKMSDMILKNNLETEQTVNEILGKDDEDNSDTKEETLPPKPVARKMKKSKIIIQNSSDKK